MKKNLFQYGTVFLTLTALTACGQADQQLLDAISFRSKMDSLPDKMIVDVRTPEEFNSGHVANARNINIYDADFSERISKLDKKTPVFVYCKAGSRSAKAAAEMKKSGIVQVYDLKGGMMAWTANNLPVEMSQPVRPDAFTKDDFQKLISENKAILIDYHAQWCLPCKKMQPTWDKLSREYEGKVTFSQIDIDEADALAKQLHVGSIPVISVYKNGVEVKRVIGFQTEEQLRELARLTF